MAVYTVEVVETETIRKTYTVEAPTESEAETLAENLAIDGEESESPVEQEVHREAYAYELQN